MKGAMRQLMIIALISCSVNAFWSEKTHSQKPEYSLSDKDDVHEIRTANTMMMRKTDEGTADFSSAEQDGVRKNVGTVAGQCKSKYSKLYLSLLRDTLTGTALQTPTANTKKFDPKTRKEGSDWCEYCYTMAGSGRLDNVADLLSRAISENVPGDFLETGVWRGGTSMYARAVMDALGQEQRSVFLCDSYEGLPKASTAADSDGWSKMKFLRVSVDDVRNNFNAVQLSLDNVHFVKGFFQKSLPTLRDQFRKENRKLVVLRGDGDMYESYTDILYNLYEFVPVGGYFICDDCPKIGEALRAIDDFRKAHGIKSEIQMISNSYIGLYWKKEQDTEVLYSKYLDWNTTRKATRD